jgi:hypothetical protein
MIISQPQVGILGAGWWRRVKVIDDMIAIRRRGRVAGVRSPRGRRRDERPFSGDAEAGA